MAYVKQNEGAIVAQENWEEGAEDVMQANYIISSVDGADLVHYGAKDDSHFIDVAAQLSNFQITEETVEASISWLLSNNYTVCKDSVILS